MRRIKPVHVVIAIVVVIGAVGGYLDDRKEAAARRTNPPARTGTETAKTERRLTRCGWKCRQKRADQEKPFKVAMQDYARLAQSPASYVGADLTRTRGKMVVVADYGLIQELDDIHFELPDSVRAITPEEVGTVVLLKYDKIQVGQYSDGAAAHQSTVAVTVIDPATRRLIASTTLHGPSPPPVKRGLPGGAAEGAKPTLVILDYVLSVWRAPESPKHTPPD